MNEKQLLENKNVVAIYLDNDRKFVPQTFQNDYILSHHRNE